MPLDIFKAFQQRDTLTPFIRIIAGDDSQKAFYYETDNALMSCGIFRPLSGWNEQIGTAAESALEFSPVAETAGAGSGVERR